MQDTPGDPLGDLARGAAGSASSAPREPAGTVSLRVLVGGDVLPHRPRLQDPARIGAALAPLTPFFKTSDAVVVNYEAATGDPDHAMKMAYVAPPEWLSALHASGVSAVTVANNHACDMGSLGVRTTLSAASAAGLQSVGADTHTPFAPRVIAEKDGKRVCAVAWTNLSNGSVCENGSLLAFAPATRRGTADAVEAVRQAKKSCDAVIAIFHGGHEYAAQTNDVIAQAKRVAEAGADAVVMHHPHIISPVIRHETKDGRTVPIFASVGNLVTNQGESWKPPMFPVLREDRHLVCVNGWTRLGMLADLAFSFTGKHKALSYASHLVFIENEHAEDKKAPMPKIDARMLSPTGDKDVIARLRDDAVGPVAVFDDACWFEGSGKRCDAESEGTRAPTQTARASNDGQRATDGARASNDGVRASNDAPRASTDDPPAAGEASDESTPRGGSPRARLTAARLSAKNTAEKDTAEKRPAGPAPGRASVTRKP